MALCLAIGLFTTADVWAAKPAKISPDRLTKTVGSGGYEFHHGSLSLTSDTVVSGKLAVLEGSLDLATGSRFDGDVWVVNGDVILQGHAQISGQVHIVNGELFQSRDASVQGQVRTYVSSSVLDRSRFRKTGEVVFVRAANPDALPVELSGGFGSGNRVEFSSVQFGLKRGDDSYHKPHWKGHARMIVPFRDNTRGFLGFDLDLRIPVRGRNADLRIQGFKKTVTNDDWQYSSNENSWAMSVTHNDFLNYYERSGGSLGIVMRPTQTWTIDGGVYVDQSRSLITRSSPSLFNNELALRANPPIDEGEIAGATFGIQYDTRIFPSRPSNAWFLRADIDAGADIGPGDFQYATLTLDARRYNRLARGLHLDLRGRMFTTRDNIPRQRWQTLNGYGGVRGLSDIPFDAPRGDRLALFSAELRISMPQIPIVEILYTRWNLLAFADIGILKQHGDQFGAWEFLESDWSEWGKSVGVGISGESFVPYLGFYVAQDLDRNNTDPRFIVRFERSF